MTDRSTGGSSQALVPVSPGRGRLRPLGLGEVEITGGPWARRQQVNASATLAHNHGWMERLGWLANFVPAGAPPVEHQGMQFADSEVYKLMEAMAWEGGRSGSPDAQARLEELTSLVATAQEPDGYLNSVFGRAGQRPRYSDLEWGHELYCDGHLMQAAVARGRAADRDDPLVGVARAVADHVCAEFGPGGIERVGGHPEIEMALVELARLTGEQRYLDQAVAQIERRGRGTLGEIGFGPAYFQDDRPVRDATVFRGHAVRALYLASGAVDVAVESGDDDLLAAVIAQWEKTIARRTYLTGGMGSHHTGEAFGDDFVLPPDRAYSETCAGIASVMLAWRLLLATGEARFADLMERTLYNVVATSPSAEGTAFFYANPLHQRVPGVVPDPDVESRRASSSLREPWFLVACCPNNLARTLASLAGYVATADRDGIQLHQLMPCRIATDLDGGRRLGLEVSTGYPHTGRVAVRITEADGDPATVGLRVPAWAEGATVVRPDGGREPARPGLVRVEWPFRPGDEVVLDIPIAPRLTRPDSRIDAVRGCVAVERGPLVLCAESVDLPDGADVDRLVIDSSVPPRDVADSDGSDNSDGAPADGPGAVGAGVPSVLVSARLVDHSERPWPYADPSASGDDDDDGDGDGDGDGEGGGGGGDPVEVVLRPYSGWGNRGPATMRVWLPTD